MFIETELEHYFQSIKCCIKDKNTSRAGIINHLIRRYDLTYSEASSCIDQFSTINKIEFAIYRERDSQFYSHDIKNCIDNRIESKEAIIDYLICKYHLTYAGANSCVELFCAINHHVLSD